MANPRRELTEAERAEAQATARDREAEKIAALRRLRESATLHPELVAALVHTRTAIEGMKQMPGPANPLYEQVLALIEAGNVQGFIDFMLCSFETNQREYVTLRPLFARTIPAMMKALPKTQEEG